MVGSVDVSRVNERLNRSEGVKYKMGIELSLDRLERQNGFLSLLFLGGELTDLPFSVYKEAGNRGKKEDQQGHRDPE